MTDLHVVPHLDFWRVRRTGAARASCSPFTSKAAAILWARARAARVFVHRGDGTIERVIDG